MLLWIFIIVLGKWYVRWFNIIILIKRNCFIWVIKLFTWRKLGVNRNWRKLWIKFEKNFGLFIWRSSTIWQWNLNSLIDWDKFVDVIWTNFTSEVWSKPKIPTSLQISTKVLGLSKIFQCTGSGMKKLEPSENHFDIMSYNNDFALMIRS